MSTANKESLKKGCEIFKTDLEKVVPECPVILVGTKTDERDQILKGNNPEKVNNIVSHSDLVQCAKENKFLFAIERSAKANTGLAAIFRPAIEAVLYYKPPDDPSR